MTTDTILIFATTIIVAFKTDYRQLDWSLPTFNTTTLIYTVSIAGWLLTPMDASIFLSLWTVEKSKIDTIYKGDSNLDFNIGYWGSLILALCFLFLGASLLSGAGEALPKQGGAFITQIIGLFSNALGNWSFPVICFIAFTVMYSTLVTVMDGYARNVEVIYDLTIAKEAARNYQIGVLTVTIASCLVILFFMKSFTGFIDLVGVLVFVLGPVYAILNHKAVFGRDVPLKAQPSSLMRFGSLCGIVIISIVAIAYCYFRWNA